MSNGALPVDAAWQILGAVAHERYRGAPTSYSKNAPFSVSRADYDLPRSGLVHTRNYGAAERMITIG
jgi:hypothetical protein